MIHGGRHQVEGRKMGEMNSPSGERLMWKGTGHVASRVDDEKKGGPRGPKRGGGWMTHGSTGKAERG
jgi:hypothetical protein